MTIPSVASPGIGNSILDSVQKLIDSVNTTVGLAGGVYLLPPTTVAGLAALSATLKVQGARCMVTDTNKTWADIGVAPTAGGSAILPVYHDGTNWLIG